MPKRENCVLTRNVEWTIRVPRLDNSKNLINPRYFRDKALKMAKIFGGVTIYHGSEGCFASKSGALQCEPGDDITAIREGGTPDVERGDAWKVYALAGEMRRDLGQESVMVRKNVLEDAVFVCGKRKETARKEHIDFGKRRKDKECVPETLPSGCRVVCT